MANIVIKQQILAPHIRRSNWGWGCIILLTALTACHPQMISLIDLSVLEDQPRQSTKELETANLNAHSFPFEDVTDQANIQASHKGKWLDYATNPYKNGYLAMGAAWADYDNDGWQDLFVTGNLEPNVLYRNNQDGTFQVAWQSEMVSLPDIPSGGGVWADFDNDGWRDLYVLNLGQNRLYRNIDGTRFADITAAANVGDTGKATSAAWGDFDNDGWLDLYVANWSCFPECSPLDIRLSQDVLYHNNGDGTFRDVSHLLEYEQLLGSGFAASFADFDNDGDLDIYVVNDKVSNGIGNVLWRNDGAGCESWCWTDASKESGSNAIVHGMGLATGDYNNDGDLDFYFSNMVSPMVLLDNQGDGTFINATKQAGVGYSGLTVGWGTAFFDYDNDGWLDLYQTATSISDVYGKTGMMFAYPDRLYRNIEGESFSPVAMLDPQDDDKHPGMGFSVADYDNDGHIDFVVGNWSEGYRLYKNQGKKQASNERWLKLHLIGGEGVNRDAIGARVYVHSSNGQIQMREVKSGSSLGANNDIRLHFGLADTEILAVDIVWPNGERQQLTISRLNQIRTIEQQ